MTAPLSPEELAALRDVAESVEETSPLPWAVDEIAAEVYCADGDEVVATCFADIDATNIATAVNALPRLLATLAERDRESAALHAEIMAAHAHADRAGARPGETLAARVAEMADRVRELVAEGRALRERLALTESRTAVLPLREALPGLRALAASEAAAEVLEDVARCECCERGDPCEIGPSGARCCGCCMGTGVA